jgi:hypothetical protein
MHVVDGATLSLSVSPPSRGHGGEVLFDTYRF